MAQPADFWPIFSQQLASFPRLLDGDQALAARGRGVTLACAVGLDDRLFHLIFSEGRIIEATPGPVLMRSWRFAFRATAQAWSEYWRPVPSAGWHDLFALIKRGEAAVEGDLLPFMTHLQYFKDVLALPRTTGGAR